MSKVSILVHGQIQGDLHLKGRGPTQTRRVSEETHWGNSSQVPFNGLSQRVVSQC